ncbi:hypothetical protein [Streptomyces sp. NPDC006134]|uniref:hypothetical protein n=1 Tax=Streptomyces sp. NPDC006134 TaxID=3154467 RepID=UPI0033F49E10
MHSRHKLRGGTDAVERFCVGVWFTGHLAAVFTLGALITDDDQDLIASHRSSDSQPDAGPEAADHTV